MAKCIWQPEGRERCGQPAIRGTYLGGRLCQAHHDEAVRRWGPDGQGFQPDGRLKKEARMKSGSLSSFQAATEPQYPDDDDRPNPNARMQCSAGHFVALPARYRVWIETGRGEHGEPLYRQAVGPEEKDPHGIMELWCPTCQAWFPL